MSEQQENLKRLIDLNKTRREEKLSITAKEKLNDPKTYEVPEEVEDGMVPVIVKAKQKYEKTGKYSKVKDLDLEQKYNALQLELEALKSKPIKQKKTKTRPVTPESSSSSPSDSEEESDVDYRKIQKKIQKRVQESTSLNQVLKTALIFLLTSH